jgi:Protein of unknown function (DUF3574)
MNDARKHWTDLAGRTATVCALMAAIAGCTLPAAEPLAPSLAQQTRVSDRLYFGRAHAAGVVSEAEWAQFLAEVVTPRFPDGLTVWAADGQWRDGTNRAIVREPTFVLELVHMREGSRDAELRAVVTAYKQRFSQQSVLWLRDRVTVIQ